MSILSFNLSQFCSFRVSNKVVKLSYVAHMDYPNLDVQVNEQNFRNVICKILIKSQLSVYKTIYNTNKIITRIYYFS